MTTPPVHPREQLRLTVLRDSGLLRRTADKAYDDFVLVASALAGTPISLISLVDHERQWFKARTGIDIQETPRNVSFCAHAITEQGGTLLVEDSLKDRRFSDNPYVTSDPAVRFYYGMQLRLGEERMPVGTLCVIDHQPRILSVTTLTALQALSRIVERYMNAPAA
jgi:GAF domain-containing protein